MNLSEFTFENNTCDCVLERKISAENNKLQDYISVRKINNELIKMRYESGNGLKIVISKKSNIKNNVVGEFIGIKNEDLESYKKYFIKYGYIKNNISSNFENVDIYELEKTKHNLKALVDLLSNQIIHTYDNKNFKIRKILDSVIYLLLNDTNKGSFTNQINGLSKIDETYHLATYENENGRRVSKLNFKNLLLNKDESIYLEDYNDYITHPNISDFCKKIYWACLVNDQLFDKEYLKLSVFLIKFIQEKQPFFNENICFNYLDSDNIFDDEIYDLFSSDSQLTNSLLVLSKHLIKKSFDDALINVCPKYDIDKLRPSWEINDLLTAMYFSLFYLDSSNIMHKRCANINCNQYFEVSRTNSKKIYCSPECSNNQQQRKYRANKQI